MSTIKELYPKEIFEYRQDEPKKKEITLKNDKERNAFVDYPKNWELTECTTFTQTLVLRYKGMEWYKVAVAELQPYFDSVAWKTTHRFAWNDHHRFYRFLSEQRCFEPITKTEVIADIKAADQKERGKKS